MPDGPQESAGSIAASLFQNELETITAAIESYGKKPHQNIAIIADPFAGQQLVIEEIKRRYPDTISYLPFFSVVTGKDFIPNLYTAKDVVVMERCHFLALRKIGGFVMLDEFLDFISSSEKLFITTWNSYSWSYLNAVRQIEGFFPEIIHLPKMDSKTLKDLILVKYEGAKIEFVDDRVIEEKKGIEVLERKITLPIVNRVVSIPWITYSPSVSKLEGIEVKDAVFDRINSIADGNYGVAQRVWERSLDYPEMKMSNIPVTPCAVDLTINEAFLLTIILSMESIQLVDLAEIAGPEINIDQNLYRLIQHGLVEEEKGYFHIKPEALKCVGNYLTRIRMVW
ncbi:MAG: hypothetical protein QCH35_01385 [Methanomicrobiaceae archaeon]|nr:hypothetical protein [Methanomicrobiaceae archaeon]